MRDQWNEAPHCSAPKPADSPWCEWIHYTPNPQDVRRHDFCMWGRVAHDQGIAASAYTIEDLAGETLQFETGPAPDWGKHADDQDRVAYITMWNRTGTRFYHEEPLSIGDEQTFSFVIPPDPPYLLSGGTTSDGAVFKAMTLPGMWAAPSNVMPLMLGRYTNLSSVDGPGLRVGIQLEPGETRSETTVDLPHFLSDVWFNAIRGDGHSGNFSVFDPEGRLRLNVHNGANGETVWHSAGFAPIPGRWAIRLELNHPAVLDTRWEADVNQFMPSELFLEVAGFDSGFR